MLFRQVAQVRANGVARVSALPVKLTPPLRAMWMLGLCLAACGSRSELRQELDASQPEPKTAERCNQRDDDGDGDVDETFRDRQGRYIRDEHCGACDNACTANGTDVLEAECQLVARAATCVATRCAQGLSPTRAGGCAPRDMYLCLECAQDTDCGPLAAARCVDVGGEARCMVDCEVGCAPGYACNDDNVCVPEGGSCRCEEGQTFDLACASEVPDRKPSDAVCVGRARCENGVLSECSTAAEICDEIDNDCNGIVDDGFRDALGSYSLNPEHCGQCGSSCLEDTQTELELACGGDPFAPRCVLLCPDARDGIQPGDKLDGDQDIASGCECSVTSLNDFAGPLSATGPDLDVNCDGADGVVVESFYVAPDGDDTWAGSPTRPLRTLSAAMTRARESLETERPRPHVFVASGAYTETLELLDGISLHGGYRRDFRALDPAAFQVELRAPADSVAAGGAALIGTDVGETTTRVEWITVRGRDATSDQTPTFAAYLVRPGRSLTLRDVELFAGVPGRGQAGQDGSAGATTSNAANAGGLPRAAIEDGLNSCVTSNANRVTGGAGAAATCGGIDVSGGRGGTASCPVSSASFQGAGAAGSGAGGAGGAGGNDAQGPIQNGVGCPSAICCGLADFSVSGTFQGPRGGASGSDGSGGGPGAGCTDALGSFLSTLWLSPRGQNGNAGSPGGGGGGGGAGGGVLMTYFEDQCEFADGLGGGGGGGGAGGCGGAGGSGGASGAPSIALYALNPGAFTIQGVTFGPAPGGRGGRGGAGGDGGRGSAGGFGGSLSPQERITPTLAGTFAGARGGRGGDGGAGGGGGGGCGGSSIGIWVAGKAPSNLSAWRNDNNFALGAGGEGGEGGGGARVGGAGKAGEAIDVVVR